MRTIVTDKQIEFESSEGYKPHIINSGITPLPLTELGDRQFELLSYLLIKNEIKDGKHPEFTNISLMQGVGERGRDCTLFKENKICGLVQCKKTNGRITRPALMKEIIKFILFSLLDSSLIPNPDNFHYILFAANDLSEPASTLMNSPSSEITKEIESGTINDYIKQVANDYESFISFRNTPPTQSVIDIFKRITLSYSNSVDLTHRIYNYNNLLNLFFRTISVVDLHSAGKLIREIMDDYGLRFLSDDDLKSIQHRIGNIDSKHRASLGIADFFGFSHDFFKQLKTEKLKELLYLISKLQCLLDSYIIDFTAHKIHELIRTEITNKLLYSGKIHQFSISIAQSYLLQYTLNQYMSNSMSKRLSSNFFIQTFQKEKTLQSVIETVLNDSERIMNKDYSHLAGDPSLIALKIDIYKHLHEGFKSIKDAKKQLKKDLPKLRKALTKIEDELKKFISPKRTIIINDTSFLDDDEKLKKIATLMESIR
ncbi:TPA: hypothetical protein ACNRVB_004422 [Escherichia coli]